MAYKIKRKAREKSEAEILNAIERKIRAGKPTTNIEKEILAGAYEMHGVPFNRRVKIL